jgi:hypothetical protein
MPKLGCRRCGLVLEVVAEGTSLTRPCHRCVATMRPLGDEEATQLRAVAGVRGLKALRGDESPPMSAAG